MTTPKNPNKKMLQVYGMTTLVERVEQEAESLGMKVSPYAVKILEELESQSPDGKKGNLLERARAGRGQ